MCICVCLFGLCLVVVESRKGQMELIIVVVSSAVEVKLNCRDEQSRMVKCFRIILFKFSECRISNLILEFKLANQK